MSDESDARAACPVTLQMNLLTELKEGLAISWSAIRANTCLLYTSDAADE